MAQQHGIADHDDRTSVPEPSTARPEGDRVREFAEVFFAAQRSARRMRVRRFLTGLNRFYTQHFSVAALRWRMEALRAGISVSDVIRHQSLRYPVSRVMLIHRTTGILLQQVQQVSDGMRDGDMVSGMLTVIRDFMHDSLDVDRSEQLHSIRVGNLTVLIESGPHAVLAGILAGDAPLSLREIFSECLDRIHAEYGTALIAFDGDTERFAGATEWMRSCLKRPYEPGDDRISPLTVLTVMLPLALLLMWGGVALSRYMRWQQYIGMLRAAPDVVITQHGRRGGGYFVEGLRAPGSTDPESLLLSAGFAPHEVSSDWTAFQALDARAVLDLAGRVLRPPRSVVLRFDDGMLVIEGSASEAWVKRARERVSMLPGVLRWNSDGLEIVELPEQQRWRRFLEAIENEPGYVVLEVNGDGGPYRVRGLRDPLARHPLDLMREGGVDAATVRFDWEPYVSLAPPLVLLRAQRLLQPPDTVTLRPDGDRLVASGAAPSRWITRAGALSGALEGFSGLVLDAVRDLDREALQAARDTLQEHQIFFIDDLRSLWPDQDDDIKALIGTIRTVERIAARVGDRVEIVITGRPKPSGNPRNDRETGLVLARRMRDLLLHMEHPGIPMVVEGGAAFDAEPVVRTRRREHLVTFVARTMAEAHLASGDR